MSVFTVASRYAKSLIDLSKEQGNLDLVKADMEQFIEVLKSNSELLAVLKNPIIKQDKKKNILSALFKDKVQPSMLAFFNILVSKGRSGILYDIAVEFVREYNEVSGIVHASVVSASPMSEENLNRLAKEIEQQINAKVVLDATVDASLIGGFVVKVGDRQLDASVAGKLNKLEKHFSEQAFA